MDPNAALRRSLRDDATLSGDALARQGFAATAAGLFEEARERFSAEVAGRHASDPRAWQVLGLAERGLQDSAAAHAAFAKAAGLAPSDPLIAHSLARTALEAGFPAVALFDRARRLAPSDGAVVLGRAAAQAAQGAAAQARADLAALLGGNPGWIEGHLAQARLTAATAPGQDPVATLRAAIARFPRQAELWAAMVRILGEAERHDAALAALAEAARHVGDPPELRLLKGYVLGESGAPDKALAVLDGLPAAWRPHARLYRLRALIRLARLDDARALVEAAEAASSGADDRDIWPYRSLIWRMTGDPRWQALEGDPRLISVHDLSDRIDLNGLATMLRGLHRGSGRMLDQSVRGGTQTEGNLLARAEPEIRALRAALMDAVAAHVAQLPAPVPGHPVLLPTRGPVRVAGAWSVRLSDGGFHVDHVHQQGWLSSAFYVALPQGAGGIGQDGAENDAGWLAFGESRALNPAFEGFRKVAPKPGQLVIFPSTMWHGTRPFDAGERLTVAFDIAPPPSQDIA